VGLYYIEVKTLVYKLGAWGNLVAFLDMTMGRQVGLKKSIHLFLLLGKMSSETLYLPLQRLFAPTVVGTITVVLHIAPYYS